MPAKAKAKGTGHSFEDHVSIVNDAYRVQRRADLERVCPPTRVIRAGRFTQVVQLDNPFLDYMGTWTERGGMAIHLEAKSTQAPRLDVCNERGVSADQIAALQRWHDSGAAVGVLWEHGHEVRFVTLNLIKHAREVEDRASVAWINAYPIPAGTGIVSFDFLAVLASLYPCKAS